MKKERVGYFGGTFDPPHFGHIILALESKYQLSLDALWWILTPDPPHKVNRKITPVEKRLEMLSLVVGEIDDCNISDVDLKRSPPHYAADTVEILKGMNPDKDLVYIIGEDSLMDLPDWHDARRFVDTIDQLAVVPRPSISTNLDEMDHTLPGIKTKTVFIPDIMMEISSSVIRARVQAGKPFEHFLPDPVSDYIRSNNLYSS